jgi:hypothetical protein
VKPGPFGPIPVRGAASFVPARSATRGRAQCPTAIWMIRTMAMTIAITM